MLNKIKKKIGFAFRLYGYLVAMSIYTIMISLPIGALTSSVGAKAIIVAFSIVLYLVICYFAAHDLGEKDYVGRRNPIDPPKMFDGFIFAVEGQIINILFLILSILPLGSVQAIATTIYRFTNYMYLPNHFVSSDVKLSTAVMTLAAVFTLIPMIISVGFGYLLGYKGIKISSYFKLDKREIHSMPREDDPNTFKDED